MISIDDTINPDSTCVNKLAEYQKPINELLNTIIGETLTDLDGERSRLRIQETNLGNLAADAFLSKAAPLGATLAVVNGGSIRSSIPSGKISLGQVREIMPFGSYLTVVRLSGQQIISCLENGVSQVEQEAGRFLQVAGFRYTWDPDSPAGNRIKSVEIKTGNSYQPLDPTVSYNLATSSFLTGGGDGFSIFQKAEQIVQTGFVDYEVVQEYITVNSPLRPEIEGRILSENR